MQFIWPPWSIKVLRSFLFSTFAFYDLLDFMGKARLFLGEKTIWKEGKRKLAITTKSMLLLTCIYWYRDFGSSIDTIVQLGLWKLIMYVLRPLRVFLPLIAIIYFEKTRPFLDSGSPRHPIIGLTNRVATNRDSNSMRDHCGGVLISCEAGNEFLKSPNQSSWLFFLPSFVHELFVPVNE